MPKSLVEKTIQNTDRSAPVYLPRRIRVSSYRSYRLRDVRPCLVRNPHQAPYQLANGPVALGFVRVKLLELQTGVDGVLPPEQAPNSATVFSANAGCEIVRGPTSKSITKRQPPYRLNSPRLVIGTSRFGSSLN